MGIAPAFAGTIHSFQGADLDRLMADLCIGDECSRQTCYVAFSRTKTREGMHILKPFPLGKFQHQEPLGPQLLLQALRNQKVEQGEIARAVSARQIVSTSTRDPLLPCATCGPQPRSRFSAMQLEQGPSRKCTSCIGAQPIMQSGRQCSGCRRVLQQVAFSHKQWQSQVQSIRYRIRLVVIASIVRFKPAITNMLTTRNAKERFEYMQVHAHAQRLSFAFII